MREAISALSREATCLSAWRESIRVIFGSEHPSLCRRLR